MVRMHLASLRSRMTVAVIVGAIVPLAVIGAWFTISSARSGRALLQADLQAALNQNVTLVETQWQSRLGDVGLIAENEAAQRSAASGRADSASVEYFDHLAAALRDRIAQFTYRNADGSTIWQSPATYPAVPLGYNNARVLPGFTAYDVLQLSKPITIDNQTVGTAEILVPLSSLLIIDSTKLGARGGALRVLDRSTNRVFGAEPRVLPRQSGVVAVRASLANPPLDLILAAPDSQFVAPFQRAARVGILGLCIATVITTLLTFLLTRRLTRSLDGLVEAADAVTRGEVGRTVDIAGDHDVARLGSAFNTMTSSLEATLHELSRRESLAAVGEFAAVMSHEVRNGLTAVRLDLQRVSEQTASEPERGLVRRALRNVQQLDTIVTGALRVARTDKSRMRRVLIEGVLRNAIATAEPAFIESGAAVELRADGDARLYVQGDAGALEQLFVNLLINAAQAMATGGSATVLYCRRGDDILVRVTDTGHGIHTDHVHRIGEPFFSLKHNGTGLGLPIAQQIAQAHGGSLSVVTTGDEGTVIEVVLPAHIS